MDVKEAITRVKKGRLFSFFILLRSLERAIAKIAESSGGQRGRK